LWQALEERQRLGPIGNGGEVVETAATAVQDKLLLLAVSSCKDHL
jgi:hypothetical protein